METLKVIPALTTYKLMFAALEPIALLAPQQRVSTSASDTSRIAWSYYDYDTSLPLLRYTAKLKPRKTVRYLLKYDTIHYNIGSVDHVGRSIRNKRGSFLKPVTVILLGILTKSSTGLYVTTQHSEAAQKTIATIPSQTNEQLSRYLYELSQGSSND